MNEFTFLAGLNTVFQLLDGWLTYQNLKRPDVVEAGGPFGNLAKWVMDRLGKYLGLIVLKGGAIALVWAIVYLPMDGDLKLIVLFGLAALMSVVVWKNWEIYRHE